jgi:hypothetical protein
MGWWGNETETPPVNRGRFRAYWECLPDDERRDHGEGHESDQNPGERLHTAVGDGIDIPRAEHAHEEPLLNSTTLGIPGFGNEFDGNQNDFENCKSDHDVLIHF